MDLEQASAADEFTGSGEDGPAGGGVRQVIEQVADAVVGQGSDPRVKHNAMGNQGSGLIRVVQRQGRLFFLVAFGFSVYAKGVNRVPESQLVVLLLRARIFGNKMADWVKIKERQKRPV